MRKNVLQTFIVTEDFTETAKKLDSKRLGKQRVEAFQIWQTLYDNRKGWQNHPAVKMWRGFENALLYYMNTMVTEWTCRGYINNMFLIIPRGPVIMPWWLSGEYGQRLRESHRSNLLRKDLTYYAKFGWVEPNNLPYWWPSDTK